MKDVKCNLLEYETIKRKFYKIYVHCQIYNRIGSILDIMIDKITLKRKGCNRIDIIIYNKHLKAYNTLNQVEMGFNSVH